MDHKLDLEINGEKAANYLRLFLTIIFTAGTIVGLLVQNQVSMIIENYVIGVIIYIVTTLTSALILRFKKYTPRIKYITMGMELFGYSFVLFGFLRLTDPEMLTIAINDIVLYAIYFIIIGESTLRFSPRFSLLTGVTCTIIFTVLGFLIQAKGGDKAAFAVTTLTIILGALFIFAMTVVAYFSTKFVRKMVLAFHSSEINARKESARLQSLVKRSQKTISELEKTALSMTEISDILYQASQNQYAQSQQSIAKVDHFLFSMQEIASLAGEQEQECEKAGESIRKVNRVSEKIDRVGREIIEQGEQSQKISQNMDSVVNRSREEIKNIALVTEEVSKIVNMISNISSQTNLLSLNASIEAAKAGDEGSGFEVVAHEVSRLADSSKQNARQIAQLIDKMKEVVARGQEQMQGSTEAIQSIYQALGNITGEVASISELLQSQLQLANESGQKTENILTMARRMREMTQRESESSQELKNSMQEGFTETQELSSRIDILRNHSAALQTISEKLRVEIAW